MFNEEGGFTVKGLGSRISCCTATQHPSPEPETETQLSGVFVG